MAFKKNKSHRNSKPKFQGFSKKDQKSINMNKTGEGFGETNKISAQEILKIISRFIILMRLMEKKK